MASRKFQQLSVLVMSTAAFTMCFAAWMLFAVIGIPIKEILALNETQFGLLAACFSLPGGVLRAVGGWLSDRYGAHKVTWWVMWVSWICLFLLSYPHTEFTVRTVDGPRTFSIHLNVWTFTTLMFIVGVAWAFGKASVFKYISNEFPEEIGAVSGIVGLVGGLGGFLLPIMFGALLDLTGVRSSAFMLLYGVTWVSLIWMYLTEVRRTDLLDGHEVGARTDAGSAKA